MPTTPGGLRYPASTAVADVPADIQNLATDVEAAIRVPAARVNRSTSQSIPTGVSTAVSFTGENYDTDTIHDVSANQSRLTCRTAGIYNVGFHVLWGSTAGGTVRSCVIRENGVNDLLQVENGLGKTLSGSVTLALSVNDFLEVFAFHDAGVNVSVLAFTGQAPAFWMTRVGKP